MKRQSKLTSQHQAEEQQVHTEAQQTSQESMREFGTPEELLRHDALHTHVPPTVAHRLQSSLEQEPAPTRSWWRKLFGP